MRDSLLSLVIAVVMLALAGIITVFYGSGGAASNQSADNPSWQRTKIVIDVVFSGLGKLIGLGGADNGNPVDVSAAAETGWQKWQSRFQEEFSANTSSWSGTGLEVVSGGLLHWQTTANGSEISFTPKSGGVYSVPIPWRLFTEMMSKNQ